MIGGNIVKVFGRYFNMVICRIIYCWFGIMIMKGMLVYDYIIDCLLFVWVFYGFYFDFMYVKFSVFLDSGFIFIIMNKIYFFIYFGNGIFIFGVVGWYFC